MVAKAKQLPSGLKSRFQKTEVNDHSGGIGVARGQYNDLPLVAIFPLRMICKIVWTQILHNALKFLSHRGSLPIVRVIRSIP